MRRLLNNVVYLCEIENYLQFERFEDFSSRRVRYADANTPYESSW